MELSKKTTILLPPRLHQRLSRLAKHRRISLGQLIRQACERQYGLASEEERLGAVTELEALELPVDDPQAMKAESLPEPEDLLP